MLGSCVICWHEMESPPDDLLCGVCNSLLKDPHTMPCEHTFCLRPCLLRIPGASEAVCIFCEIQVDAEDLEANPEIADRVSKFQEQLQQKSSSCSSCQILSVESLCFCAHCEANICTICEENHLSYYRTLLQQKLQMIDPIREHLKLRENTMKIEVESLRNSVSKHTEAIDVVINEIQKVAGDALLESTSIVESVEKKDRNQLATVGIILSDLDNDSGCVMDINSYFEEDPSVQEIMEHIKTIRQLITKVNTLPTTSEIRKKLVVHRLVVSKVFKTIGLQLDGFPLLNKTPSLPFAEKCSLTSYMTPLSFQNSNRTKPPSTNTFRESEIDDCSVFLVGLHELITERLLREYFEQFGTVSEIVIRENDKGQIWSIVRFDDPNSVRRVLRKNEHKIGDTFTTVRQGYKNKSKLPSTNKFREGEIDNYSVFIGGLHELITERRLRKYFEQFGTVSEIVIRENDKCQTWSIIRFDESEAVRRVLLKNEHKIGSNITTVRQGYKQKSKLPSNNKLREGEIDDYSVYIGGLNAFISEYLLREYFEQFGTVFEIVIRENEMGQRWSIVRFDDAEGARRVLLKNKHKIGDTITTVWQGYKNRRSISYKASMPSTNPWTGFEF